MKKFSYQATDINGKIIRGQEMAEDYQDLQQKLKERNLYITRYRDLGANDAVDVKYKFKTKEVSFISRQLASMTSAGLSLVRALYILQEQQTNKKAKRVLLDIYEEVQKGKSFSEVLESKPGVFPDLFVSMVAAGESSGTLDQILVRVSDHFANAKQDEQQDQECDGLSYHSACPGSGGHRTDVHDDPADLHQHDGSGGYDSAFKGHDRVL